MANLEHIEIFRQGVSTWNQWRTDNPSIVPDLSNSDLKDFKFSIVTIDSEDLERANYSFTDFSNCDLSDVFAREANFSHALLAGACLWGANLIDTVITNTNLQNATLRHALLHNSDLQYSNLDGCQCNEVDFFRANLSHSLLNGCFEKARFEQVKLTHANLDGANLRLAQFWGCDLSQSSLRNSDLFGACLIDCALKGSDLTGSNVYGISVWDLDLSDSIQKDLRVSYNSYEVETSDLIIDNLEVAQFIYLIMKNEKIRTVIDTITSKVVLILGRFTEERKKVLECIKELLRKLGYVPIIFDFKPSASRDLTETIQTLASMSKFVIADLTDGKSIPQELSTIVPHLPSVPIQPILLASQKEYSMYEHWRRFPWVLPEFLYKDIDHLLSKFEVNIIDPVKSWQLEQENNLDLKNKIMELEQRLADLKRSK